MEARRIGFIGAGNMATAMISGLLGNAKLAPDSVRASDVNDAALASLRGRYSITTCAADNGALIDWAQCVVLAVKPQNVAQALQAAAGKFGTDKLLVSLCAGIGIAELQQLCGAGAKVVRAMPNTPALVGAGATALAASPEVSPSELAFALELFGSVGRCWTVTEAQLDAVTGLSGSGPAYVMLFIEALADGGVRSGLSREIAQQLALQTVLGSARLLLETNEHPAVLRDRVTSPAGTTAEGLAALERGGVRHSVIDAVCSASQRSRQLGTRR